MAAVSSEYVALALRELGVPLMLPHRRFRLSELLRALPETKDTRLLETLPVVLVTLDKQRATGTRAGGTYDREGMAALFSGPEGNHYAQWVAFSLEVVKATPAFRTQAATLESLVENDLQESERRVAQRVFQTKDRELPVFGTRLSAERMQTALLDYGAVQREMERGSLQDRLSLRAQYDLDKSLAELFTVRQRELLRKRLDGEAFTRSEKVYFYRTVLKRLKALANQDLHRLAVDLTRK